MFTKLQNKVFGHKEEKRTVLCFVVRVPVSLKVLPLNILDVCPAYENPFFLYQVLYRIKCYQTLTHYRVCPLKIRAFV